MKMIYVAKAFFPDGTELTQTGGLAELSNWSDNIIRSKGACTIEIQKVEEGCESHDVQ